MLRALMEKLSREVSGQNCLESIQRIARFHRIQASPGYRAAAEDCCDRLQEGGVEAFVRAYPATGRNQYWGYLMPQEWVCEDAELWLLDQLGRRRERLAWFTEMNLSVIQRSCATPPDGLQLELAAVDDATKAESWVGADVAGKLVLVGNGDTHAILRHARQAGAAGLLTARMTYNPPVRPEGDLADDLQYTSFWWDPDEAKAWGFVVSTRTGDRLRQMLRKGKVSVWAKVDARFYDGTIENVEGVIPGTTDEEVLVVAHLCHPKPSANDNAGGPATAIEAMRALQKLIDAGELPRPRRSIRVLFPPEFTGTYPHLAALTREGLGRIAAALNVDMVSQNQELTGSVLRCEYPPLACPSFAGDLLSLIFGEAAAEAKPAGHMGTPYALYRHAVTAFSGGSDHYILADPTVGIPCPMIIQWPDRFYHTSADTVDKADPAMARRVAVMIATYAYFAANAGPAEAAWLAGEMAAAFPAQLHKAVVESQDPEAMAGFRVDRKLADLEALRRLGGSDAVLERALETCTRQVKLAAEMELQRVALADRAPAAEAAAEPVVEGWTGSADLAAIRPARRWPGPVSLRGHLCLLAEAEQESWRQFSAAHSKTAGVADYLCFWADGQRTLSEICRLAALETGVRDDAFALGYFQLLARLDLVTGL